MGEPWAVEFAVPGLPVVEGNLKIARFGKRCGRCGKPEYERLRHDNAHALEAWRSAVATMARSAMRGRAPFRGAVEVELVFFMPRPKTMPKDRVYPHVRPDKDKLERAVKDALTGLVYFDDGQVTDGGSRKRYPAPGDDTGVIVRARGLDPQQEGMRL